jgi:nucleotide-binding universal stress UspA family protein
MKTILVINDHSPEAKQAAEYALELGCSHRAKILLGTKLVKSAKTARAPVYSGAPERPEIGPDRAGSLADHLTGLAKMKADFQCPVDELDISELDTRELAAYVHQHQVWLIVKGTAGMAPAAKSANSQLDLQRLLNQVLVPVFLIPMSWRRVTLKNFTYMTDLRYCRIDVIQYLMSLTEPIGTNLFIAHLLGAGSPDMSPGFALDVFSDLAKRWKRNERLFLHHLKDTDLSRVADVLINGMKNDGLVLINHSQQYRHFIDGQLNIREPELLNAPLLLYPH